MSKKLIITTITIIVIAIISLSTVYLKNRFNQEDNKVVEKPIETPVENIDHLVTDIVPPENTEPIEIEDKSDKIILESPRPEALVSSPLKITGKARGNWFFEASFPVTLTNWDGLIIAEGIATAQSDWMTEDFVPFEAVLDYKVDTTVSNRGSLILKKDNPSGLPEHDDYLEITVFFVE